MRRAQCLELEVYTHTRRLLSILFYRCLAYSMPPCLYVYTLHEAQE